MAATIITGRAWAQAAILLIVLTGLFAAPEAYGFGTLNTAGPLNPAGQRSEHERITRAALACAPGVASTAECFEPRSIDQLAGHAGTFGAVGSPDVNEIYTPQAHCDDADFLDIPGYPQSRPEATARLLACVEHLRMRFRQPRDSAAALLRADGTLDVAQVDLTLDCNFSFGEGRAKCNALEGLGRALHGVQDFYSHSNYTDEADPDTADEADPDPAISIDNPPGLNLAAPSPIFDLRGTGTPSIPRNLTTGFFKTILGVPFDSCPAPDGRVTHECLNKDKVTIDPVTGVTSHPQTPRGQVRDNAAKAVAGAIAETRRQWKDLRGELISRYGAERGQRIISALTQDAAVAPGALTGTITTVAGTGKAGFGGDGGPATAAKLIYPWGVAVGPDGSLYIADSGNHRVRRVGRDGTITTVAGNGQPAGFGGDGGPATAAKLNYPYGVAVGPDGSLYIVDAGNSRVRRVRSDGTITTVAGNRQPGFGGDGGPATAARLAGPYGVAVGPDGSLYIADSGNRRVRRVGTDGTITTVAGNGGGGFGGDGGPATAAMLASPLGVAVGPDGSLYITDSGNSRVRRVGPNGTITTVAGNGQPGFGGDGGPATAARLWSPYGVAVGPDGSLYITDQGNRENSRVRRVGPDGTITTFAGSQPGFGGDGGPATAARLFHPYGVAVGPDGSLYIADRLNERVRKVVP